MAEYELSPLAETDLVGIWQFITDGDPFAADKADKVLDRIHQAMDGLAANPMQGFRRLTWSRAFRFFPVYNYLIVYSPSDPVTIVAVLHGALSGRRIRKTLEGRK